jgi:hypothetical protein
MQSTLLAVVDCKSVYNECVEYGMRAATSMHVRLITHVYVVQIVLPVVHANRRTFVVCVCGSEHMEYVRRRLDATATSYVLVHTVRNEYTSMIWVELYVLVRSSHPCAIEGRHHHS